MRAGFRPDVVAVAGRGSGTCEISTGDSANRRGLNPALKLESSGEKLAERDSKETRESIGATAVAG
jgi:hypothetical protein